MGGGGGDVRAKNGSAPMPRRKMDEQAGGNPRHDSPLSALSPRPLSLISLQSKAEFGDFLVLRGAGGASVKPSVPRLAVVKGVDMSRPSSSSWRTLNVRVGDPKNSITLSLSLSLCPRPNTRDSRSTQSHGNERMPSLVGNLVVALGRGRSRLSAPPWLALLVPVSAKSCLFFFFSGTLPGNDAGLTWDFYTQTQCKFKPREQKKKSGTFPSFDRDRKHIVALSDERAMAPQTRRAAAASAAANEMSPKKKLLLKALAILLGVLLIVSGCGLLVLMGETSAPSLPPSASDLHDLANPDPPLHPSTHTRRRRGEEERAHELGVWHVLAHYQQRKSDTPADGLQLFLFG